MIKSLPSIYLSAVSNFLVLVLFFKSCFRWKSCVYEFWVLFTPKKWWFYWKSRRAIDQSFVSIKKVPDSIIKVAISLKVLVLVIKFLILKFKCSFSRNSFISVNIVFRYLGALVFAQTEISEIYPRVRIFSPHFRQISETFIRIYPRKFTSHIISSNHNSLTASTTQKSAQVIPGKCKYTVVSAVAQLLKRSVRFS